MLEERLSAELTLQIIQYLNVRDAGRLAQQSRRCYYLVHQFRHLRSGSHPDVGSAATTATAAAARRRITSSSSSSSSSSSGGGGRNDNGRSSSNRSMGQLCRTAASQMRSPPQLVIAFHRRDHHTPRIFNIDALDQCLPKETVVLGVYSNSEIQTIHCGGGEAATATAVDCQNQSSVLMIGGIPPHSVEPFSFSPENDDMDIIFCGLHDKNPTWKAFLVFVGERYSGNIEQGFLQPLQARFPQALIIGGLGAAASYVPVDADRIRRDPALRRRMGPSIVNEPNNIYYFDINRRQMMTSMMTTTTRTTSDSDWDQIDQAVLDLCHRTGRFFPPEDDTVCGVALSDAVPIQGLVSRGMKSYVVQQRPSSSSSSSLRHIPSPIRVKTLGNFRGTTTTIALLEDIDTKRELTCVRFLSEYGRRPLIGLRRPADDGFHVGQLRLVENMISLHNVVVVNDDDGDDDQTLSLVGAEVELLEMTGDSLKDDVVQSMIRLRDQTLGQKVLGAVMVSCNGRGPHSDGVIDEDMYDAKVFGQAFPGVPCLGFYANGEIGPAARVGQRTNLFRTGDATVQGFTAVFGLFIVPDHVRLDTSALQDASPEAIASFINERLVH